MAGDKFIIPTERVYQCILVIRGLRVVLDADLAKLFGVTTKRLNEQVKRNPDRFSEDFMFQLTAEEKAEVVANCDHLSRIRFSAVRPHAFTEHGAIMAANVLHSPRAVEASVLVVRAFVRLRQTLATHRELAEKLAELERRIGSHDEAVRTLMMAIHQLMEPPSQPPGERIGFRPRRGLSGRGEPGSSWRRR